MDIKEQVKEESSFQDLTSQNEREFLMKDLAKKVKIEILTSSSDIKPELEDSTSSHNEGHNLLRFKEIINERDIETKIDIKEEDWLLEREDSCINDIKVLEDILLDLYRTLKTLYQHETDDVLKVHVQVALEELNKSVVEFLFPQPKLEKRLYVIDPPES